MREECVTKYAARVRLMTNNLSNIITGGPAGARVERLEANEAMICSGSS